MPFCANSRFLPITVRTAISAGYFANSAALAPPNFRVRLYPTQAPGTFTIESSDCVNTAIQNTARADPARDGLSTEPMDINSSCVTSKHARDAKISEGVWDPQSHTTVCGGCASAGWQSQAAKRSSGFPRGKHLTNPADRSRGPVRDRQPSQRCDQNQ